MLRNGDSSVTARFLEEHRNSIRDGDSWAPFGFARIQTTAQPQGAENSCQIGPKPVFLCVECCDQSADIDKLMEHLITEHVEYAPYVCTFEGCGTTRYSRRKLEEHIRAKRHGKITAFRYEEDKRKRRVLIDLLEASCGSGNERTKPLIKIEDDEKPPEVEEMSHVPMPTSTPVLPVLEDNDDDFCDVDSAPKIAAEVPLSISRSHFETGKDVPAATPAEAPKWNKVPKFRYEGDKEKRRLVLGLIEASCSSGNETTNPFIKLNDDETPPEDEEMAPVPMHSSTSVLSLLDGDEDDFCNIESSPKTTELPLSTSLSDYEIENDPSTVTPAEATKWNKKYEKSASGKVQMEPMNTRQQGARNCPTESEIGSKIEMLDMVIDSTGNVVSVTKSPIENSRPPTAMVHKKLHDFDGKVKGDSTKIDQGEIRQKRRWGKLNESPSSPVVPVKRRPQRRKACHPAIITKKDREGYYEISAHPYIDLTPTPEITANVTTTIERFLRSHKVELLKVDGKRDSWTKMIGFIIGRAVNTYFRRYTESALPLRTPYYFIGDIPSLPDASVKQQLMALPEPVFTWFQLTLADDFVRNELEEMTEQESRYTMWYAMQNVRKVVLLSASRHRKQERM